MIFDLGLDNSYKERVVNCLSIQIRDTTNCEISHQNVSQSKGRKLKV